MRIEQLKYLIAVADYGSFTGASNALYVAQPSISQSISALEKELCVTLLKRTKSGVEPTGAGREIILHARKVLSEIDYIMRIAKNEIENATVTIVAAPIASSTILPMVMAQQDAETVRRIEVIDAVTEQAEHLIDRGEASLAIIPYINSESINSQYIFEPLFDAQCMALVNAASPLVKKGMIDFEEIQKHPLSIFSSEYISYDIVINRISKYGKPNIIFKTLIPRPLLTKSVVSSTECIGISFDVGMLNNDFIKTGELLPLYINSPVIITFGLLYKKDSAQTPLFNSIKQQIKFATEKFSEALEAFHQNVKRRHAAQQS